MKTNSKTAVPVRHPAKSTASSSGAVSPGWTVLCSLCALLLVFSARGNTYTWSGGAVPNANWSVSANWGGVGVPGNGDTIIFSGSHTNAFVNTNNISGLSLNQIQFVGDNTFGVKFDLRGNAFTLTGSILATNVTGTNIIENNVTLPNASELFVVSNSDQLIIEGVLSGVGGVTKAGAGTLTYQCSGNNTYTNTTLVNGGTLQFNVSGSDAVSGPLIIGDGTGDYNALVEDLQNTEMYNGPSVTINAKGVLYPNNFAEAGFTTNVIMNNGLIEGAGTLDLQANTTITANGFAQIGANLNLNGALTLQGSGDIAFDVAVGGSGNILQTGAVEADWLGPNTYSGSYTADGSGSLLLENQQALGNINNTMTLNGTTSITVGADYAQTNQSLTVNSSASPVIYGNQYSTNSWKSSFIFNTPVVIDVSISGALILNGPISGPGSVTEVDIGQLIYTGTSANTYSGATTVNGGLLLLDKSSTTPAVPGSLFIGSNATVRLLNSFQIYNQYISVTLSNSSLLDLAGFSEWVGPISMQGAQITSGAGSLYFSGNITVNPSTVAPSYITGNAIIWDGTYVVTNTGHYYSPDIYLSANLSSGGTGVPGLIKDGPGEVSLTGNNTFNGPVTVNNGNLWAQTSSALGSTNYAATVNNGGTLFLDGNGLDFGLKPLVLNGTGWAANGANATLLCNGSSSWEGNVTLNSLVAADTYGVSTLTMAGPISGLGGWQEYGTGTNIFSGSLSNSYAGTTTVNSGTLLLNKAGGVVAAPGNLVIDSSGAVQLEDYGQMSTNADVLVNSFGLFDLASQPAFINTLRGTGTVNFGIPGRLEVGCNNGSSEFDGYFTGYGFSLAFTLAEVGTGTFTFGGDGTFTLGDIYLPSGELVVNGFFPTSIPVLVETGATLAGAGRVGSISANGTVVAGVLGRNIGGLTSGNVTFGSTGNFIVQIPNEFDGPGFGLYANETSGTNTLGNATLTVVPAFTAPLTVGQQFVILSGAYSGPSTFTNPVSGTFNGLPNGALFNVDGIGFQINYTNDQVVLTVTNLPPKPVITAIQPVNGGGFQLTGVGSTNLIYSVWASTNLTTTNWMDIGSVTVPATTNLFQFTDTNTVYYADRFYRFTWP